MQRVIVTIDGQQYTIIGEDSEEHIKKSAELVDAGIKEVRQAGALSSVQVAVLTAMNIADKYYKALQSGDNLRSQIRSYAEECASLRSEIIKLKKNNKEG